MNKRLVFLTEKGKKLPSIFLFMFIVLTITLACNLPFQIIWTGSSEDNQQAPDEAKTAVVERLTAEAPKVEESSNLGGEDTAQTEEKLPTETPSPSPSPTVTLTPTPEQVTAFINKNTNCRIGPKDVFELIHIFVNGDRVDLLGKNQDETFWYVKDQDGGSIECWIWTEYADLEGSTENVPVFTPPPVPAPIMNFVLSYKSTTGKKIQVSVRNTGNVVLQSYTATYKDTVTSEVIVVSSNQFGSAAKISVGNTGNITSDPFSASTSDHQINVTVKACSQDGQSGKCLANTISFKSN